MKQISLGILALLLVSPLASARFSERKLESSIDHAERSGKLIAFVFYQEYRLPNCPKCVTRTDAANKALKSAVTRGDLVIIEIEENDRNLDEIPKIVTGKGVRAPAIVVTDAKCENVLANLSGAPDRDKAKEFKATVKGLRGED